MGDKNDAGRTNIFSLGLALPPARNGGGHPAPPVDFNRQTGLTFKGIDVLNVSIGTANFIDLKDQQQNRSQKIGIENAIVKNVTSVGDLAGLSVIVALRGGDFFSSLIAPPAAGPLWR